MDLSQFLLLFHDLPGQLAIWTQEFGPSIYFILFAIIFAETGLVVTPFLPGDSLLFALGALTAVGGGLDFWLIIVLLVLAAFLGNLVNYAIGRWLSARLLTSRSRLINPIYLERAQEFYKRHGGKTIFLTRFLPIIRTYAPFVAGLSRMRFSYFMIFNIFGAVVWVGIFVWAGNRFGNLPQVRANFHYVIAAILAISVLPAVIEYFRARYSMRLAAEEKGGK